MKQIKTNERLKGISLGNKLIKVLINYVTSQLLLMLITSVLTWGILCLLNVKYALILAVLNGILSLIPHIGIVIATVISAGVAVFDTVTFLPESSPVLEGIIVSAALILLNKFIDFFLSPVLLGKTNNINPWLVFILIISGTVFFGLPGALLAVPVFLILKTIWQHVSRDTADKKL